MPLHRWRCDWSEPIPGCDRNIGDAVYYQRHVKRNDYFIPKLTRAYVLSQWQRILNDTPEDYAYDPDPMVRERTVDGLDKPATVIREVVLLLEPFRKQDASTRQEPPRGLLDACSAVAWLWLNRRC